MDIGLVAALLAWSVKSLSTVINFRVGPGWRRGQTPSVDQTFGCLVIPVTLRLVIFFTFLLSWKVYSVNIKLRIELIFCVVLLFCVISGSQRRCWKTSVSCYHCRYCPRRMRALSSWRGSPNCDLADWTCLTFSSERVSITIGLRVIDWYIVLYGQTVDYFIKN